MTEKVSIDKLLDQATLGESAWGYFWQNAFTEGTEETAGDLCDLFFDLVISQDKSEWKETLFYYEALGFSEKEAFWRAVSNQAETVGIDFLEGSAGGAVMSGTVVMGNKVYHFVTDSAGVDAALGGGKPQSAFSRLVQREQLFPSRYDQSYSPLATALPGGLDYKTALNFLKDNDLSLGNNNFFSEDTSQSRNLLEDAEREQLQREEAERGALEEFETQGDEREKGWTLGESNGKIGKTKYAPSQQRQSSPIQLKPKEYAKLTGVLNSTFPNLEAGEIRFISDGKYYYKVRTDGYGGFETLKKRKIK